MARAELHPFEDRCQMAGCERVGVIGDQQLEARPRAVWADQDEHPVTI